MKLLSFFGVAAICVSAVFAAASSAEAITKQDLNHVLNHFSDIHPDRQKSDAKAAKFEAAQVAKEELVNSIKLHKSHGALTKHYADDWGSGIGYYFYSSAKNRNTLNLKKRRDLF